MHDVLVRVASVTLLLVLVGCGSRSDSVEPDDEPRRPRDGGRETSVLVDVTWIAERFLDGSSAEPPSVAGRVRFERNGFVSGSDGCNGFGYVVSDGAPDPADGLVYEIVGNAIRFEGSPVSTLIGCSDTGYEGRIRHVLTGTVTYQLDGAQLTLVAPDGRGVVFTSEA